MHFLVHEFHWHKQRHRAISRHVNKDLRGRDFSENYDHCGFYIKVKCIHKEKYKQL